MAGVFGEVCPDRAFTDSVVVTRGDTESCFDLAVGQALVVGLANGVDVWVSEDRSGVGFTFKAVVDVAPRGSWSGSGFGVEVVLNCDELVTAIQAADVATLTIGAKVGAADAGLPGIAHTTWDGHCDSGSTATAGEGVAEVIQSLVFTPRQPAHNKVRR